jgi:hypothetical protein
MKRRGSPPGPRPHTWLVGSDPNLHRQYHSWHRARAQAHYRGEMWQLTFEEYVRLWQPYDHLRGRDGASYSMSRRDRSGPWSTSNCYMATRAELNRLQTPLRRPRRTRAEIEKDQQR